MKTIEELKREIETLRGNKSRIGLVPFQLRADIAAYFHDANISQKQLAKELGLSGTTISNVVYPREKKQYVRKPTKKKRDWVKAKIGHMERLIEDLITNRKNLYKLLADRVDGLENGIDAEVRRVCRSYSVLFWFSLVVSFIAVGISFATMVIQ
jgi:predicted transcriptional regulator